MIVLIHNILVALHKIYINYLLKSMSTFFAGCDSDRVRGSGESHCTIKVEHPEIDGI